MNNRVIYIDFFRSLAIINMIIYHTLYDLKYIFGAYMPFFDIHSWYYYQQYICISFIFLSGISANYSKKILKHSFSLCVIACIITLSTSLLSDDLAIYFGVIHFFCVSNFFIYFINKIKISDYTKNILFFVFLTIFIFFKTPYYTNLYTIISHKIKNIPFSFVLGFPSDNFYSSDYFPIIPWISLSICGYFFYNTKIHLYLENIFKNISVSKLFILISKKSLLIYSLHQIIIYAILYVIFEIFLKSF